MQCLSPRKTKTLNENSPPPFDAEFEFENFPELK